MAQDQQSNRESLHNKLLTYCKNVYFQAPPNNQMQYPCIMYRPKDVVLNSANDKTYNLWMAYEVIVIDRNPDSKIPKELMLGFEYVSYTNSYVTDNLHHTVLSITNIY